MRSRADDGRSSGAGAPADVTAGRVGGASVVSVVGECDIALVPSLRRVLDAELDQSPPVLVVDLAEATLIDSTGIGAIVAALRRARDIGSTIRVVASAYEVRQPFEVTGIGRILTIHDTLDDALAGAA